MVVVSVGGLAVSAFHQNTSFSKAPASVPRRLLPDSNSVFQKLRLRTSEHPCYGFRLKPRSVASASKPFQQTSRKRSSFFVTYLGENVTNFVAPRRSFLRFSYSHLPCSPSRRCKLNNLPLWFPALRPRHHRLQCPMPRIRPEAQASGGPALPVRMNTRWKRKPKRRMATCGTCEATSTWRALIKRWTPTPWITTTTPATWKPGAMSVMKTSWTGPS